MMDFAYQLMQEATTLGFQRDLQTSHRERGDLKKRVVEKDPKGLHPCLANLLLSLYFLH
jgi:hypothetical protein